ncbi:hypothetical protein Val02_12760 [Virgisporangium aliadipatigenens]|uniref:SARP family transcriptional regulator n=1 Tax=Virgisporangium aliadipatigenens TaxID=741659 RepID=A0A8J3YI13_9ACTN|nr:BTAD domain-containing putative transcriptional regulator [Virgisporangium aliadipatigenens]GIJ44390.1 hypothetical protein Val02_12760 [Virgisporangium aliadipatigenens]
MATWLRLVGTFEVWRDGSAVETALGSRKARVLLAMLAVRRGVLVPGDSIVDSLWADDVPRDPRANVATLVSRLRAAIGTDAVLGDRHGYRLSTAVGTDLDEAVALLERGGAREAAELLGRGPLLPWVSDVDWLARARDRHAALLRDALLGTADAALAAGAARTARAAADAVLATDPLDERATRALMRACLAGGDPAGALRAYERLRRALADELGTVPTAPTRRLHVAVLREEPVGVRSPSAG